jgi:tRNA A-37 threonylcarbamoyl transferase component Bud32/predicted nucleotidyltransferase
MQVTKRSTDGFLEICQGIAGSSRIVAAFLYGPSVCGYAHAESDLDILLIVSGLGSRLKTYKKSLGGTDAFILAVDQGMFERDVRAGWLGEITAEKLLIPFDPLVNAEYLWQQEVTMKRRVIWEVLESIALEFPELSHELSIKPEYFMYESQMQLARLFPPVAFRFINMLQSDVKDRNVESMMKGYRKALEELSKEKWITFSNGLVRISPKFVSAIKSRKIRIPIFLRAVQRAAFLHVFSALPRMMTPLGFEEEIYFKTHADIEKREDVTLQLEDPKKYLLMSTPLGPVPLSDATTIEEFVRKTVPGNVTFRETKQIGGIFNSVYELTLKRNSHEQRIVVKKFKDWTGFKWFPLTLWSLGTKTFAVLGKSRLEREYAINQYMKNNGLNVPRVLYISLKQSLIFEEYVDGKNLTETIRNIVSAKDSMAGELELIRETGRKIAETHQIGVSLGDCKPENIIVTRDREICFVDLEQATRDGDQTWDIAEFLYYSGHYVPPLATADQIVLLAKVFLEGYIERGGDLQTVKKAASPRYTKVFSLFTQPHIMLAISTLCRKMNQK